MPGPVLGASYTEWKSNALSKVSVLKKCQSKNSHHGLFVFSVGFSSPPPENNLLRWLLQSHITEAEGALGNGEAEAYNEKTEGVHPDHTMIWWQNQKKNLTCVTATFSSSLISVWFRKHLLLTYCEPRMALMMYLWIKTNKDTCLWEGIEKSK